MKKMQVDNVGSGEVQLSSITSKSCLDCSPEAFTTLACDGRLGGEGVGKLQDKVPEVPQY